ncbi:MAG: hypothetical protein R3E01_25740 [Pirellulaceae bacterium]|nr:hypothetical protein [Planctomycetales bacterium]
MPVSGLVVTFSDEPQVHAATLTTIRQESRITIGVEAAGRLAIVLDTLTPEEDRQLWEWLQELPGVRFVEVAFVGVEQFNRNAIEISGKAICARHTDDSCGPEGAVDER